MSRSTQEVPLAPFLSPSHAKRLSWEALLERSERLLLRDASVSMAALGWAAGWWCLALFGRAAGLGGRYVYLLRRRLASDGHLGCGSLPMLALEPKRIRTGAVLVVH